MLKTDRNFIDEELVEQVLCLNKRPDPKRIEDILQKSLSIQSLNLDETAALLNVNNRDLLEKMQDVAFRVKKKVYDNRIVTFAPLYLSNLCINNCLYCGFREDNLSMNRRALSLNEIQKEVEVLAGQIGHKRLIVVYGEHPKTGIDYMASTLKKIYEVRVKTKKGFGQIRRVNVNAPPLSVVDLRVLKECGIGTYQVFQETYHQKTYQTIHPNGTPKHDYQRRLHSMHRAFDAGIDDVGIGALFGLYDWKFETLGLVSHARELQDKFGVGPHTISFPRLEPAPNAPFSQKSSHLVSDDDFKKLITVIRLSVPYTGMIISARESARIRRESILLGCTQLDASPCIGVGSYSKHLKEQDSSRQQFFLGDTRSLDDVVKDLAKSGFITSFCTAGYRCGRTGECIMKLLKNGKEGQLCKLNAVLTFREWLDDFAKLSTKEAGEKIINNELNEIKKDLPLIYPKLSERYDRIKSGERDLYF